MGLNSDILYGIKNSFKYTNLSHYGKMLYNYDII